MPSPDLDQEKALLFSEVRFRALFRNIPAMAVTLDADWTILSANSSCTSQLGYTIDELEGQSVLNLFFEEDRAAVAEELRRCLENPNQVHRWQFRKVHKDGELMWVEETAQAVFDLNGTLNVLVVCQDVSERKQLAADIQDAREYAENIVETVREPLMVLNSDLKILTANHSFYDTFKVTPEETIGNFIYDLGNRQWDIPKLRELLEEILPHDTVINGYEVEHDFLDIGRKTILLNARQVFRENISSHIILLAMEDITERKRAEEALRESAAEMEESKRLGDALNEIDTVLFSAKDYDVIMNRMLQLSAEAIGAETGVIFSKESDGWTARYEYGLPRLVVGQNFSNTEVMHTTITAGTKRSLVVQDVKNNPDVDQKFVEMLGICSLLDFPLILKGEVIGDLTFHYHSSPVPFNERQVEFVRKLQISISLALENNRLLSTSKHSESKLKEAEKLGKFGYFHYDVHTRKTTWSEGVFHIFGRDPALGEPTVEEFFELYSVDPGQEKMRELVGSEATSEFEAKIKRGDLTCFFHFVVRSVKDEKGDFAAYFGTVQDISERKHDEEALQESEMRFHAIFDLAAVGIAQLSLNGHWMLMNQKLSDILGYSFDELLNMTLLQISHPDDIEPHLAHFRRLLAGEVPNYTMEKRYIRKDGSILWVNLNVTLVRDQNGEPEYFIAISEDINERKRAQDALRESEERFHLMADTAPVLIWMAGVDSLCTFFNKPWLAFTGRSFEQEQGNGWAEGIHPDDMQRCLETYRVAFNARRNFEMEYRLRRADGVYRWIVDAGVPRFMPNGDFSGYIGSCFDITERKSAEEEIRKLNMVLAEKADELDAANKELEAFNYTVAHDLRGPLNNIGLYFQTIQQLAGAKLDETCREYLTGGHKSVQRMNQLIDVLLQFSKLSDVEPQREIVDLSALTREIADELTGTSPERRYVFRIADGLTANGDPKLLRVALINLLCNAWKYTGKKEEAVIEFSATEIGGKQAYFVRDNGEGFDLADADKLFVPFQRLPGSEEFKGSGIGLATVERIIRRHGGKVWAEGERGKGACFYFTLSEG